MAKNYADLRIDKQTKDRFVRIKNLLSAQNNKSYSMSGFLNYLLDFLKPARI